MFLSMNKFTIQTTNDVYVTTFGSFSKTYCVFSYAMCWCRDYTFNST